MNRGIIITGLKNEGRRKELVEEFLNNSISIPEMKHVMLTTSSIEHIAKIVIELADGKKDIKKLHSKICSINNWSELKDIIKKHDDKDTVFYLDNPGRLKKFKMKKFMKASKKYQFDYYLTIKR